MWPVVVIARGEVLEITLVRGRGGFEMRFTNQCGAIAGLIAQLSRNIGPIGWKRDAVHDDAMGAYILAADHCRPRRHADRVLIVGAAVI